MSVPTPPSSPPSPPPSAPVPPVDTAAVELANRLVEITRQNKALQSRLDLLEEQILKFGAGEERKFAKNFLDDVATLKSQATRDLSDFTEKFDTFAQAARQARENAEKELETFIYKRNSAIRGYAEVLSSLGKDETYIKDFIGRVKTNGTELTKAVAALKVELETLIPDSDFEDETKNKYVNDLKNLSNVLLDASPNIEQFKQKLGDLGAPVELINSLTAANVEGIKSQIQAYAGAGLTAEQYRKIISSQLDIMAANTNITDENTAATIRNKQAKIALADNEEKLSKALKGVSSNVTELNDKFLGSSKNVGLFSNSIVAFSRDFQNSSTSFGSVFSNVANTMKLDLFDLEKSTARLEGFIKKNLIDSTFEFDKAVSELNKTTGGFGGDFEKTFFRGNDLFKAPDVSGVLAYGMGLKDLSAAYGSLSKNVGTFNSMSEGQKKIFTEQAAVLSNLGISTETYSKLISNSLSVGKKDMIGATEAMDQLAKTALALGKNVEQFATEFQNALPKLVGFSKEAKDIFTSLSAISQVTNNIVSTNDLTSIAEKFMTIEGAADGVSKLNAVFGGLSLNIMDLAGKDPAEIIMSIKRAASAANIDLKNFDTLNIGYKRALAELFGGDVQKAAAFFKSDLDEISSKMGQQNISEQEFEERKKRSADAQKKLNAAIDSMKISLSPALTVFTKIAEAITYIANLNPFMPFVVGFGVVFGLFVTAQALFQRTIGRAFKEATMDLVNIGSQLRAVSMQLQQLNANLGTTSTMVNRISRTPMGGPPVVTGGGALGGILGGVAAIGTIGAIVATSQIQSKRKEEAEKESDSKDYKFSVDEGGELQKRNAGLVSGLKLSNLDSSLVDITRQTSGDTTVRNTDGTGKIMSNQFDRKDSIVIAPSTGQVVGTQPGESLFTSIFGPTISNMIVDNPITKTTKQYFGDVSKNTEYASREIFTNNPLLKSTKEFFSTFVNSAEKTNDSLVQVAELQNKVSNTSEKLVSAATMKQEKFFEKLTTVESTKTEVLKPEQQKPIINLVADFGPQLGKNLKATIQEVTGEFLAGIV